MSFDNNGFFELGNVFGEESKGCFFTDVDTSTITGRNQVLNYLARMEFEIRAVGFSEAVVELAGFYDDFVHKSGNKIADFYLNPVIKMILEKIETMPKVKNFLYERVFDFVKEEYYKECEQTFNNTDELNDEIKQKEQEFKKSQIIKNREIKKLAKENNITFEEAEKLYNESKQDKIEKDELLKFMNSILPTLPLPNFDKNIGIDIPMYKNKNNITKNNKTNKNKNKDKTQYVSLDDDTNNNDKNQNKPDDFWNL